MLKYPFSFSIIVIGFFLSIIPANFARPSLFRHMGRGGGRIRIGASWIDVSRWELERIVAELTPDEAQKIQDALHQGHVAVAQDLLAAALRYFQHSGRTF